MCIAFCDNYIKDARCNVYPGTNFSNCSYHPGSSHQIRHAPLKIDRWKPLPCSNRQNPFELLAGEYQYLIRCNFH